MGEASDRAVVGPPYTPQVLRTPVSSLPREPPPQEQQQQGSGSENEWNGPQEEEKAEGTGTTRHLILSPVAEEVGVVQYRSFNISYWIV